MKIDFGLIKKIITILSTGTTFVSFIVTELCTNKKSKNYVEYTDLSKFCLNLYIFILLLLCFCHALYPKMVCFLFTNGFGIITTDRGKLYIMSLIIIMFFSTESLTQKLFGMISFVAAFALFLADLLLNCETLKQKPLINNRINHNIKSNNSVEITNSEKVANVINNPMENNS